MGNYSIIAGFTEDNVNELSKGVYQDFYEPTTVFKVSTEKICIQHASEVITSNIGPDQKKPDRVSGTLRTYKNE